MEMEKTPPRSHAININGGGSATDINDILHNSGQSRSSIPTDYAELPQERSEWESLQQELLILYQTASSSTQRIQELEKNLEDMTACYENKKRDTERAILVLNDAASKIEDTINGSTADQTHGVFSMSRNVSDDEIQALESRLDKLENSTKGFIAESTIKRDNILSEMRRSSELLAGILEKFANLDYFLPANTSINVTSASDTV